MILNFIFLLMSIGLLFAMTGNDMDKHLLTDAGLLMIMASVVLNVLNMMQIV